MDNADVRPMIEDSQTHDFDIAIVGMAGMFPDADSVGEYWENLREGKESITFFSDAEIQRSGLPREIVQDRNYVKAAPILKDPSLFDAKLFNYSPREAMSMDPQQRLFLKCCWEALEDAGYVSDHYDGRIG